MRNFCTAKASHIFTAKINCVFTYNMLENLMSHLFTMSLGFKNKVLIYAALVADLTKTLKSYLFQIVNKFLGKI